jgi:tetratricopeptide (TPR) repeat protein
LNSSSIAKEPNCFSIKDPEPFAYQPLEEQGLQIKEEWETYCSDRRISEENERCLYIRALIEIGQKNLPKAKKLLIQSLEKKPDYPAARVQLGYVYLWLGELKESREEFSFFYKLCPCEPKGFSGLEQIADTWAKDDSTRDMAIDTYYSLLKCSPYQTDYLYKLGTALSFAKRYDEAEKTLLKCLEINPKYADAATRLGYLYLWQNRLTSSESMFLKFKDSSDSIQGLKALAVRENQLKEQNLFPIDDPTPLLQKPEGEISKSIEKDLKFYCDNRKISEDDPRCLYVKSILYISQGNLINAKGSLIKALSIDPKYLFARLQLSYLYLWLGDFERAQNSFALLDKISPCDPRGLFGLEQIADHLAKEDESRKEAIKIYEKLLTCSSKQTDYLYKLGSALAFSKEYNKAEKILLECLKINPNYSDAAIRLGYLYLWQDKLPEAKKMFEQFENLPDSKKGLSMIASKEANIKRESYFSIQGLDPLTYIPHGKTKKRIEHDLSSYCKHKNLNENDAECLYAKGILNIAQGNLLQAKNLLLDSLSQEHEFPFARLQLSYVYLWLGEFDKAKRSIALFYEMYPCNSKGFSCLEKIADHLAEKKETRNESIKIYQSLVNCSPDQPDYLYKLGTNLAFTHQYKRAEEVLLHCLKVNPNYSDASIRLGYLYLWQGDFDRAEDRFKKYENSTDGKAGLEALANRKLKEAEKDLLPIFEPKPFTYRPKGDAKVNIEKSLLTYCERKELAENDPKCLFAQSIISIAKDDLFKAKEQLIMALNYDPEFTDARLQLSYVYLWLGELQDAKNSFAFLNELSPCDPKGLPGLEQIADDWAKENSTRNQSVDIYEEISACSPNQTDYLYKLGSSYALAHQYKEAEEILIKCLDINPEYTDATIRLGFLYLWQGNLAKAKKTFLEVSDLNEAKEALGNICLREKNYKEAEYWYEQVDVEDRTEQSSLNLARSLSSQLKYTQAKKLYHEFLAKYPNSNVAKKDLFEVKLHTSPSLVSDTSYTQTKENDPSLNAPVVRDCYFNQSIIVQVPVVDKWRLDFEGYAGYQKEVNLYRPEQGDNYDATISGGKINSRFYFHKDWVWNIGTNIKYGSKIGTMTFPFKTTTQFQPGTSIIYNSERQLVATSGYVDSFVIKNFQNITSYLLEIKTVDFRYRLTGPWRCKPEVEGWAGRTYYRGYPLSPFGDGIVQQVLYQGSLPNKSDAQIIWVRCGIPGIPDYAQFIYSLEHRSFDRLNLNYYSFKQQKRNNLSLRLHHEWNNKVYAELTYKYWWQRIIDLFQPIGNFIYVDPLQYLHANIVDGVIGVRANESFKAEVGGHYYKDTLPLRVWSAYGNFTYAF